MSSSRDVRAMVASIEKSMQQLRSLRGSDVDVERRRKALSDLEEDVTDATALLRVTLRSGVDSSRLSGKLDAAKKLSERESQSFKDGATGNDSVPPNPPDAPASSPPAQHRTDPSG